MYSNLIYGIFNPDIVPEDYIGQHYNEQKKKTFDCVEKFEDFLKSMEQVETAYQQEVFKQCCILIANYMIEYNQKM